MKAASAGKNSSNRILLSTGGYLLTNGVIASRAAVVEIAAIFGVVLVIDTLLRCERAGWSLAFVQTSGDRLYNADLRRIGDHSF